MSPLLALMNTLDGSPADETLRNVPAMGAVCVCVCVCVCVPVCVCMGEVVKMTGPEYKGRH